MNRRNLMDLINCDSDDKEKMIEAVKEKLRWYTFEASEEEFDTEAVDALVKFLREVEPELGKTSEKENDKTEREQKKRVIKLNRGRIAAAVVIGALVLTLASVIVGNSLGTSLAWEEGGFFRWLRKDEKGQTMITSPEDLGMEIGKIDYYYNFTDVPNEYQQYLFDPIFIGGLEETIVDTILVYKSPAFQKISEILKTSDNLEVEMGVIIYTKEVNIIRNTYDDYKYQFSDQNGDYQIDVYSKESVEHSKENVIFVYNNNREFFVSGTLSVDNLHNIVFNYINYLIEKN